MSASLRDGDGSGESVSVMEPIFRLRSGDRPDA
jgi:hypothetical protein